MIVLRALALILSAVLLCSGGNAWAAKQPEVDYLSLAALLARDGHYDRAEAALDNIDEQDEKLDRKRFYTLKGLVKLHNRQFDDAISALGKAVEAGEPGEIIHVYLAQAYYGLQQYPQAIAELDKAPTEAAQRPELTILRAQAQWQMGDKAAAWDTLSAASVHMPENADFARRQVFMLIELGLYQAAAERGREFVRRYGAGESDLLALGRALRESGEKAEALAFLEEAHLRFPQSEKAALELAHAYLDDGKTLAAAELFEQAAIYNPALMPEAAELFRTAGKRLHALNLNARIVDSPKKMQQRLALLLELKHFEQIVAMNPDLVRTGLAKDESVRYALAYAYFKTQRFGEAEQQLAGISNPELFAKATALRTAMADCEDEPWECL